VTPEEVEAVRTACARLVRLLRNMSEALTAASNATRLCAEAADVCASAVEEVERDPSSIAILVEPGDEAAPD
jgi:hypothetical protein